MRFLVRHNRHHKVSQSVPLFKSRKTVTIFLRIKVGGHFVMSIVTSHESHYVGVLDNPQEGRLVLLLCSGKKFGTSRERTLLVRF